MAKKDFSAATTSRVYQQIDTATAQDEQEEYTEQEVQEARMQMKTQGKKGMKAARINMAFAPDTYDYIKVLSQAKGVSITQLVNEIIRQHMGIPENKAAFEKAQEIIGQLRSL